MTSSRQCPGVIGSATGAMRKLHNSVKHMKAEMFRKVCPSYMRPHLKTSVQVWSHHIFGKVDKIERVHR